MFAVPVAPPNQRLQLTRRRFASFALDCRLLGVTGRAAF
jgi:hypothetical protein